MPAFKVADLLTDFDLLEHARDDAAAIVRADERLARPENAALRQALLRGYGDTFRLVDVA